MGQIQKLNKWLTEKTSQDLSIATSQSWKDKSTGERKEKTEWHRVVIFNEGLVNIVQQYLKKVRNVYLEGQLKHKKMER